jgi:hypothetical protein
VLGSDVSLTNCMMDGHHSCSFEVRSAGQRTETSSELTPKGEQMRLDSLGK